MQDSELLKTLIKIIIIIIIIKGEGKGPRDIDGGRSGGKEGIRARNNQREGGRV